MEFHYFRPDPSLPLRHFEESSFVPRTWKDYFDRQNGESQRAGYIKRLEALGLKVSVEAVSEAA